MSKKILLFDNVNDMRILSNNTAWKIIELLSVKSMYPAQIAKELKIYEQSAYYYIRRLSKIGAIEEIGTRLIKGGTARLYKTTSTSFGIEINKVQNNSEIYYNFKKELNKTIRSLVLKDFFISELFDSLIVVGAPDPHGPYKSSARDGHYAVQLGFYLGTMCKIPKEFIIKLDIDAKVEKDLENKNLILIGGPGTNIVTSEINKHLPIKFNESNYWAGLTDKTGRIYNMDNHGLIAKIKNPYNEKKNIMVIAGVRSIGTKAAILTITNFENVLKNHIDQEEWAVVVQGFDMNADGKIDNVDIVS
ncbi:MAG: hypothetical protein ACPKPY_00570 [Nitrososphaeraceae archaeon]